MFHITRSEVANFHLVGRDELGVPVGGTDASREGGFSTSEFSHPPVAEAIQEKNQMKPSNEEHHNMVEEPILEDVEVVVGVSMIVETVEDSTPDWMEEDHSLIDEPVDKGAEVTVTDHNRVPDTMIQPSIAEPNPTELKHKEENQNALDAKIKVSFVGKGAKVTCTRDIRPVINHNRVCDTVMQPSIADQNPTVWENGEENQNAIGRNLMVSIVDKGKMAVDVEDRSIVAVSAEGTSTLTGKKRDIHAMQAPSITDWNPTAQTYKVII